MKYFARDLHFLVKCKIYTREFINEVEPNSHTNIGHTNRVPTCGDA